MSIYQYHPIRLLKGQSIRNSWRQYFFFWSKCFTVSEFSLELRKCYLSFFVIFFSFRRQKNTRKNKKAAFTASSSTLSEINTYIFQIQGAEAKYGFLFL